MYVRTHRQPGRAERVCVIDWAYVNAYTCRYGSLLFYVTGNLTKAEHMLLRALEVSICAHIHTHLSLDKQLCFIYIYMYIYICIHLYIYIYNMKVCMSMYVCIRICL